MSEIIYTPYTYLIGWSKLNKFYYGVRFAQTNKRCLYETGCHPDDFWVTYFTSSKKVAALVESHGKPDIMQIRKTFKSAKAAKTHEFKVLSRLGAVRSDKWLNQGNGGTWNLDFVTDEFKAKCSKASKGIKKSKSHAENIAKGRTGMKFTDEHRENIRLCLLGKSQSAESQAKRSKSISKLKWWNNTKINKRSIEWPGDDFVLGRIKGFKWGK